MEPFTLAPKYRIIVTDIGSSHLSCLLSASFQVPGTFEEVLQSECLVYFQNLLHVRSSKLLIDKFSLSKHLIYRFITYSLPKIA